jgi:uncharacterized protein YbaR (Trm112 family)
VLAFAAGTFFACVPVNQGRLWAEATSLEEAVMMSDLRSRVAYLHGLAEGLDVNQSSVEGRVLMGVLDVLGDLAENIEVLAESHDELADYIEEMDDDLSDVEERVFDEVDDVGVEMVCCPECGEVLSAGAGERAEFEADVSCPVCGASLIASDEVDPERV